MVMRVGGIASGMDIEAMVQKLMEAERMPLDRLKQQQTTLTWKRDAFREINSTLLELDKMMLDMKMSYTYNPKTAVSSQEGAITATANSNASNGSYEIKVKQLATSAMNIGGKLDISLDEKLPSTYNGSEIAGTYEFHTYDENGEEQTHEFEVREGDTLQQVLTRINNDSSNNVRAFIDDSNAEGPRVVLETTRTGVYNNDGPEIVFGNGNKFFTDVLKLDSDEENSAQNAEFKYNNGLDLESRDNAYTLNGVTFEFHDTTENNARITVNTDVEQSFESIMKFVDKYNEMIEQMNASQTEERFRDFQPLSDEQKAEMTEKQIEQWEEKAKSGILRGESAIRDSMYALRQSLQSSVDTEGEFQLLSQIGIETTQNYLDGGLLKVNENKLKAALRDHPDDVYKLFSNSADDSSRGLIHRFDDVLDQTTARIEKQAGNSTHTLDNYTIGKRMKEMNERISDFERRMIQVEQRYWNQFTQMEKAISRLNQQSSYLFSQFGDGM